MFVNRRAILGHIGQFCPLLDNIGEKMEDFAQYLKILDNIGAPYTLLARMKDRLI